MSGKKKAHKQRHADITADIEKLFELSNSTRDALEGIIRGVQITSDVMGTVKMPKAVK